MNQKSLLVLFLIVGVDVAVAQKTYKLTSPDKHLSVVVEVGAQVAYRVNDDTAPILNASPISLSLTGGEKLGVNAKVKKIINQSGSQTIAAPFYKRSTIKDQYNEMILNFKGDYSLQFRAYNEGVAYRFVTARKDEFEVESEEATFSFAEDVKMVIPYVNQSSPSTFDEQFFNSFENTYTTTALSRFDAKRLAFLPVLAETSNGRKICITEADLENYPGMYVNNPDGKTILKGIFPGVPKKMEQGGHNKLQELVRERETFIASAKGTRSFPWRIITIAREDKELLDNDMVYKLAAPSRLAETGWIKPGKVAWDWWNDWNLYGVDFKAGINTQTYKHYIDFASENNIAYVILDEGWSVNLLADLLQVVPEIDMKALADYAKQKNVSLILWVGYYAFNRDMENVCKHYAAMGIKGFKVDFMDRDDQPMVNFYYRAAETAAKYQLLLDFHGAFKPTGLNRTWPNVLNFEGVHGLEQLKWSPPSVDQVTYDVSIPFIRMLAGPLDYTQGAMRNASKDNYRPVNGEPMSQGTRCRQLAEYVVFEAPFNMLCDNPSNYRKEPECTQFIASVPTTWDNTVSMDGKISQYVAIARQKGKQWYVGALTNWTARELVLDLNFLPAGNYKAEIFKDGINADRAARDYQHELINIPVDRKLKISMAPGGGFAARIYSE